MKVSLLAGDDSNYVFPLLSALITEGITVDFIGNDNMQKADILPKATDHIKEQINFYIDYY